MTDSIAEQPSANNLTELMKVFNYGDKKVRVFHTQDEPWFCGKDVAEILEYASPTVSMNKHVDPEDKYSYETLLSKVYTNHVYPGQANKNDLRAIYINESGVYSLVLRSKMAAAKEFKKWITKTVLPSIRKNGYYVAPNIDDTNIEKLKAELDAKQKEIERNKETIEQKDKKITEIESKVLRLNIFVSATQELPKNERFYIATSKSYALNNRFKYGGVSNAKDLGSRLNSYNTGRAEGDTFYYATIFQCHNYHNIEGIVATHLKSFKDKQDSQKEMIYMRYDCLREYIAFIVENYNKDTDYINQNSKRFLDSTLDGSPIIPDAITVDEKKPKKSASKIDVSTWSDDDLISILKNLINEYAKRKLGQPYNFDTDANSRDLKIVWKDFSPMLETYDGKSKKEWRTKLKNIVENIKAISVRWSGTTT